MAARLRAAQPAWGRADLNMLRAAGAALRAAAVPVQSAIPDPSALPQDMPLSARADTAGFLLQESGRVMQLLRAPGSSPGTQPDVPTGVGMPESTAPEMADRVAGKSWVVFLQRAIGALGLGSVRTAPQWTTAASGVQSPAGVSSVWSIGKAAAGSGGPVVLDAPLMVLPLQAAGPIAALAAHMVTGQPLDHGWVSPVLCD